MFCNGECKKGKNKRCGLLLDIMMKNDLTGEQKVVEKCALQSIAESLWNQEQGQIRIQSAVENGRNEQAKWGRTQNKTLAQGFLGLIHSVNESTEAEKKVKYLGDVIEVEEEEVPLLEEE